MTLTSGFDGRVGPGGRNVSFLGVLGKIAGGVVGAVTGIATGGPIGGIVGGLAGLGVGGSSGGGVRPAASLPGVIGSPMGIPQFTTASRFGTGSLGLVGTTIVPAGPGPGAGSALIPHMACGVGYHHAKHKGALGGLLASKCVKNRHMNVTNPRALRRSIRRLTGFEKLAKRVLHITSPRKKHVFGGPRRRTRKR